MRLGDGYEGLTPGKVLVATGETSVGQAFPAGLGTAFTQTYSTATTTVPAVTAATPSAATAVATGISTAVTGVDGTGSNAASKADVDTRLGTLSTCVTALLVDIASLRTQLTAANADILANRKLINALIDALQTAGIAL